MVWGDGSGEMETTVQLTTDKQFLTSNKCIVTISPIEKRKTRKRNSEYKEGFTEEVTFRKRPRECDRNRMDWSAAEVVSHSPEPFPFLAHNEHFPAPFYQVCQWDWVLVKQQEWRHWPEHATCPGKALPWTPFSPSHLPVRCKGVPSRATQEASRPMWQNFL